MHYQRMVRDVAIAPPHHERDRTQSKAPALSRYFIRGV